MTKHHPSTHETESVCIGKEPCPACGSRDNLARYDDGHGWCFGCGRYEKGDADVERSVDSGGSAHADHPGNPRRPTRRRTMGLLTDLDTRPVKGRGITEETCQKWGYSYSTYRGRPCQVATYPCPETRQPVAQHIRTPDKGFAWLGDIKDTYPLYGQWLWRDNGRKVIITEGELDAMSISQVQGHKWPVVSVKSGAQGAKKNVAEALEWLSKFDLVVLCFDMDEPGQSAARECALLLPPGKAAIVALPEGFKDANDMLVAGKTTELVDCLWGAKTFRPDGIVTMEDISESILATPPRGMPWAWPSLDAATFGRRPGEVITIGAGTGCGKTDVLTQQMAFDHRTLKVPIAVFAFESKPEQLARRIAGKIAHRSFHVPDEAWTDEEFHGAVALMKQGAPIHFYDSWGACEWDTVKSRIEYLHAACGVNHFYIDHLTALAQAEGDERTGLERIMQEIATLAQRTQTYMHVVSHLATPEGKPHEEGGRVMVRHFKGSRAIGFWSHFMIGVERNQQAESDVEKRTSIIRVLKDRATGRGTGKTIPLYFTDESILSEDVPVDTERPRATDTNYGDDVGGDF